VKFVSRVVVVPRVGASATPRRLDICTMTLGSPAAFGEHGGSLQLWAGVQTFGGVARIATRVCIAGPFSKRATGVR
jgi:hypothetical protein